MRVRATTTACLTLGCVLTFSTAFAMQATTPAKPATQKPAAPSTAKPTAQKPAASKPAAPRPASAALRNPAALKETAPATFNVTFATTAGSFVLQVNRAWAPRGADRFYNLVKHGYYNDGRFFRVVPNFMVQFGINGDPKLQEVWREANIADDPVTQSNKRGFVTFAKRNLPNSRSTQVFINFKDNSFLDSQGFAPFGQVISGMEVVDKINAEYGEGPDQGRIQFEGNAYLTKEFPRLTVMKSVTIARPAAAAPAASKPTAPKPPVKK